MKFIFFITAILLAYTYFGYPAIIHFLSKFKKQAIKKSAFEPSVSIVLVAYNEDQRLKDKIEGCLASDYPSDRLEIIVVSDGSTDGTDQIISSYADKNVKLINHGSQRGKSACLNDGVALASNDYIVFCDTRQEIDKDAVKSLMAYFEDETVGAVSGEMFYKASTIDGHAEGMDFYWKYEKFIRKAESKFRSVAGATGALYSIRKDLFKAIPEGVVLDDVMIPMNVVQQGKKVLYSSDAIIYDVASSDLQAEERRKRRTISGNYQLIQLMPWLLSPTKNPIWFEFVSHKVLRLISPFLFILFLISSYFLWQQAWIYSLGFIGAAYLVIASLIGIYYAKASANLVIKAPLGFMSLNYFALMGFWDFSRGNNTGKWKK